jgi:hypothetical protein
VLRRILLFLISFSMSVLAAHADSITIPYSFSSGTPAQSSQVNANFTAVTTVVNGNIDNANIKASAGIVPSKLSLISEYLNLQATDNRGFSSGVTGDTVPRVTLNTRGSIDFGAGSATAMDLALIRADANTLKVRDRADSVDKNLNCGVLTLSGLLSGVGLNPSALNSYDVGSTSLPWRSLYVGAAATNNNRVTSAACTAARTFTLPDANSNSVIPDTGASNNFLTAISSGGVISKAQPSFSNISGTAGVGQGGTGATATPANGQIPIGNGTTFTIANITAGTGIAVTNGSGTITISGGTRFTSSAITASNAGGGTQAHSLGATPKRVWTMLKCITTDAGYAVNDFVVYNSSGASSSTSSGVTVYADGTNVGYRFFNASSPLSINHKTTGAATTATNANWEMYIYAEL